MVFGNILVCPSLEKFLAAPMAVSELYYVKLLLVYLERCFERMASDVRESNAAPEPPYTSYSLSHKLADAVWAGNTDGPLMICTPLAPTVQYALCTCFMM